ncbi:uncharacterized protein MONBRDRAFT_30998 [Monosiga brevicollis MX1]|uniref:Coiled-coil domain-containing protein 42 homolog n=1 Tax=Monosiga brevicollis TaxID=81824 RepID=CCD42_MONBE|nr:uncharacterized protein MONBRDRAFT_30998 [Monosiga brevicollis MX1]A9UQN0.1 RecName: Full=Coiled-coil domain-containing protein 42 homolog [Monosiga brevicollis]EDQ93073.1 predicted protein [Monosiga brevicollis MX1]|eukprot:XP_001742835.1 hypothetical protein [Monosiga brevicollis MX1]
MAGLREFFKETVEEKLLQQMPDDVLQQTTPATQLLEKRRELEQVERALATQKEDFHVRMATLDQRKAELERKEYQLQESLLKFDRFLKENDARRERAEQKAASENEVAQAREEQVQNLRAELRSLQERKTRNRDILQRYSIFEAFMQTVLGEYPEYNEVQDVITRYKTLVATQQDLRSRDRNNQTEIERVRREMARYKEAHRVSMLDCSNKLATLRTAKERAHTETLYWENQLSAVQGAASKRTLLLGQIKMYAYPPAHPGTCPTRTWLALTREPRCCHEPPR